MSHDLVKSKEEAAASGDTHDTRTFRPAYLQYALAARHRGFELPPVTRSYEKFGIELKDFGIELKVWLDSQLGHPNS